MTRNDDQRVADILDAADELAIVSEVRQVWEIATGVVPDLARRLEQP